MQQRARHLVQKGKNSLEISYQSDLVNDGWNDFHQGLENYGWNDLHQNMENGVNLGKLRDQEL